MTGAANAGQSGTPGQDAPAQARRRFGLPPVSATIVAVIVALVIGTAASLVYVANEAGKRAAAVEAREIATIIARETFREAHALLRSARDAVDLAAMLSTAAILDPEDATTLEQYLIPQVVAREGVSAIYWGSSSGDFNFVLREETDGVVTYRSKIIRRTNGEREVVLERRDAELRLEEIKADPNDPFDPLWRPWFRAALGTRDTVWTSPYRFYTSGELGISAARRVTCLGRAAACAFGADVSLDSISRLLEQLGRRYGARAFVMTADARLVATSTESLARIAPAAGAASELPRAVDLPDRIAAAAVTVFRNEAPARADRIGIVPFDHAGARHLAAFAPLLVETQGWTVGVVVDDFSLRRWLATYRDHLIPWAAAVAAGMLLLGLALWLPLRRDLARLGARIDPSGGDAAPPAFPEFRRLADRLDRMTSDAREHTTRVNAALAEATRADQAKARFLTQMSHELRTPLNAIIGFAELAKMRATSSPGADATLPRYLDDVLVSARHLLALIERVLDFARSESSAAVLQEERFPVEEALRTAATVTATAAAGRGIRIRRSGGEGVEVVADRARLCEALVNLIDNAVVHGAADSDIELDATLEGDGGLILSVRDVGPGMTREQIAVAMTPFGRAGRGAYVASKRGLGLGLSIVGDIARRHGGELSIKSTPGAGTTVSIRLPAARIHAQREGKGA